MELTRTNTVRQEHETKNINNGGATMRLKIETKKLVKAIDKIEKIKKVEYPTICQYALINAGDIALTLTTTDLDATIVYRIPLYDNNVIFKACVELKKFCSLIKKINCEYVEVFKVDNDIIVKTDSVEYPFKTISWDEFPIVDFTEYQQIMVIYSNKLISIIETLKPLIGKEDNINGICIEPLNGYEIKFLATEGHLLFCIKDLIENKLNERILLPYGAINMLQKILKKEKDKRIDIYKKGNNLLLLLEGFQIIIKCSDREFPQCKTIIEKDYSNAPVALIDLKKATKLIEQLLLINYEIDFKTEDDAVIFETKTEDQRKIIGSYLNEYCVKNNKIAFKLNGNLMLPVLKAFIRQKHETVCFKVRDRQEAIKIEPVSGCNEVCYFMTMLG